MRWLSERQREVLLAAAGNFGQQWFRPRDLTLFVARGHISIGLSLAEMARQHGYFESTNRADKSANGSPGWYRHYRLTDAGAATVQALREKND